MTRKTLATIVAAVGIAVGIASEGTASAAGPQIVSPRSGSTLAARPTKIVIEVQRGGRDVKLRLNGKRVEERLRRRGGRIRTIKVSPSHGLKHGRNVLKVTDRSGGRSHSASVRFRVRANRPLAAAGIDRDAAPGDTLSLDAGDSLLHPGAPRSTDLDYRWSIVDEPRQGWDGGHNDASISDPNSADATLNTDSPGDYEVQLTVSAGNGLVGSDRMTVRVGLPPSVELQTNGSLNGDFGVRLLGPTSATQAFYKGDPKKWLQIVVLKRDDLSFVSNTTYDCPQATTNNYPAATQQFKPCTDKVAKDVSKYKDKQHSYLLIATSQGGKTVEPSQPPVGMYQALGGIGLAPWNWWTDYSNVYHGTFAAVLTPGEPQMTVERPAVDQHSVENGLNGNLVLNNEGIYRFAPRDRVHFNTQAAGSSASQSVMQIGETKVVQKIPTAGDPGFHVVIVDPRSLAYESRWIGTARGSGTPLEQLRDFLSAADRASSKPFGVRNIVMISSRGNSVQYLGPIEQALNQIERAGGTRTQFYEAMAYNNDLRSYSLVGTLASRGGTGIEAFKKSGTADSLNSSPISGTLARTGIYGQYEVQEGEPVTTAGGAELGEGATELLQAAEQPASDWPETGNAGRTAAVKYLGTKVLGTEAPRSQYWTLPYTADAWNKIADAYKNEPFPADAQGFTQDDFGWAKFELRQEIDWLKTTHDQLDALSEPFSKTALQSWADLQKVAADIDNKIKLRNEDRGKAQAEAIFDLVHDLGEETPIIGKAIGGVAALYKYGIAMGTYQEEPAGNEFTVKVGELGSQLVERMNAAHTMLSRQLPNLIVADYGRLKTVGSCASPLAKDWASCPHEHEKWQYTQEDQNSAAREIRDNSEATVYGALIPVKYKAYKLDPSYLTKPNDRFTGIAEFRCFYPFGDSPASSYVAKPINANSNQILALGYVTGQGIISEHFQMHVPEADVTDRVFGELGVVKEAFFDRFFGSYERLEHYPERDSRTGWLSDCAPKSLTGKQLSAPDRVSKSEAVRKGIPISFDVQTDGSVVRLRVKDGGKLLASARVRETSSGNHTVHLPIKRKVARKLSRRSTAKVELTLVAPNGHKIVTSRRIVVG